MSLHPDLMLLACAGFTTVKFWGQDSYKSRNKNILSTYIYTCMGQFNQLLLQELPINTTLRVTSLQQRLVFAQGECALLAGFSIEGSTRRLIAAYFGIYSVYFVFKSLFFFSSLLELFPNYSSISYMTVIQTNLGNLFTVLD